MLICHTIALEKAHQELEMLGQFKTASSGSTEYNCYMYPLKNGAWEVRRYGEGVREHESWEQDGKGWTKCFLNKAGDFHSTMCFYGGAVNDKDWYKFDEGACYAHEALKSMNINFILPDKFKDRPAMVKDKKKSIIFTVATMPDELKDPSFKNWAKEGSRWMKVIKIFNSTPASSGIENADYHDKVRHIVSESGHDEGWICFKDGIWKFEPVQHIRLYLRTFGIVGEEATDVLAKCVREDWTMTSRPFKSEYPGNREWNRFGAKLAFTPLKEYTLNGMPTWIKVFRHLGKGLDQYIQKDKWCIENNIKTGMDYLFCWVASMFQDPYKALPYLFFHGNQDIGKSAFYEAIVLLFRSGYMDAKSALTAQGGFNKELEGIVFCYVNELDISKNKDAYNRVKEWVTDKEISIHEKNKTPWMAPNTTHWVQVANNHKYCPIFPGDTRITCIYVTAMPEGEKIGKDELLARLTDEAPCMLGYIFGLELPKYNDRLGIPVINTPDKEVTQGFFSNPVEDFIKECCIEDGETELYFSDIYARFISWVGPEERHQWNSKKVVNDMPVNLSRRKIGRAGNLVFKGIKWKVL